MFRRYFAICLAVCFSYVIVAVLFSNTLAQNQNNLGPVSSANPPSDLTKSATKTASSSAIVAEPDYPDPTSVKTLSDDDLNKLFDRMSTHYSKDAVLFNNIGAAFFQRKEYDKSEAAIRRAIVLNNHPAFLVNLSIVYDALEHFPDAINAAQRAINQAPKYVRARAQLCELMLETKRVPDTVLCYDEMSKVVTLDPASQTYYSVALLRSGNPEKAIAMVTPLATGAEPTALMFNVLGGAYYAKKRFNQASEAFKRGVEIDPDSTSLRYNLAMALTAANNRPGALSQYNLMKEKDPKLADELYRYLYRDKILFVDEQTAKTPRP